MSNPTSNFGWQMPEPTDLVTDLPADFEVFGQAVDTDFVDLLGGTTGQVLSKTSNTDLDFTWIANDQGDITAVTVTSPITGGGSSGSVGIAIQDGTTAQKGAVQLENSVVSTSTTTAAVPANVKTANDLAAAAIPKSTVTTNGDLIYGTGSAAVTRLGIGSASQILTVSGGVPSWATPAAAASGLTLIQRSSFSNVANTSTTFDGVFTSTYKFYQVVFEALHGVTADNDPILELFYSGTLQSAAYVGGAGASTYNTNTFSNVQNSGTNEYTFGTHIGNSTSVSTGIMWFSKVGNASERANINGLWFEPNDGKNRFLGVTVEQDRTYTGFRLRSSSTNITGTVAIYGLATS